MFWHFSTLEHMYPHFGWKKKSVWFGLNNHEEPKNIDSWSDKSDKTWFQSDERLHIWLNKIDCLKKQTIHKSVLLN